MGGRGGGEAHSHTYESYAHDVLTTRALKVKSFYFDVLKKTIRSQAALPAGYAILLAGYKRWERKVVYFRADFFYFLAAGMAASVTVSQG